MGCAEPMPEPRQYQPWRLVSTMWWGKKKEKETPPGLTRSHLTRWLKSWCFELLFAFPWRSDLYITGQGGVRGGGVGWVGGVSWDSLTSSEMGMSDIWLRFFAPAPPVLLSSAVCAGEYWGLGAIQYRHLVDVLWDGPFDILTPLLLVSSLSNHWLVNQYEGRCQKVNSQYLIMTDKSRVKGCQLIIPLWTFIR